MRTALITGITGQDGSYLAELLLEKGYRVHGIIRRSSSFNTSRIDHLYRDPHDPACRLFLHYGDMTDPGSLRRVLGKVRPDEVYNLAAQSHVRVSFDQPQFTAEVDAVGALCLLDAIRDFMKETGAEVRTYLAGSSEMFGASSPPQHEATPFHPRSPYGASKVGAYWFGVNYREAYGMFVANGILFNHESPRRGETFVTRKITRGACRIKLGLETTLHLGNLDAKRDWGFAGDYVDAMWRMLQADEASDFVVATGVMHSVREFASLVFGRLGLVADDHISIDPRYFRPAEVDALCGDASRARSLLGWTPNVSFEALVDMMIANDLELARQEKTLRTAGYNPPRSSSHG
ncbi:MAG: GDP-mannose 4,6-dehydratase [Deltaproteobacteria bacterium]|nr:GDP-mannose 4,6-dehydratase [Deltaproteobacteria bacterium]